MPTSSCTNSVTNGCTARVLNCAMNSTKNSGSTPAAPIISARPRDAGAPAMRAVGPDEALVHAAPHQEHRGEGDRRGAEERNAVAAGDVGEHAADHRSHQRADQLPGAEQAQRVAQPPLGHLARHQRHRGGGEAGEHAHQRAGGEELPDVLRQAHATR